MTASRGHARWGPACMREWAAFHGGTEKAGALIGVSDKTIRNYISGRHPVPKAVEMACKYADLG